MNTLRVGHNKNLTKMRPTQNKNLPTRKYYMFNCNEITAIWRIIVDIALQKCHIVRCLSTGDWQQSAMSY